MEKEPKNPTFIESAENKLKYSKDALISGYDTVSDKLKVAAEVVGNGYDTVSETLKNTTEVIGNTINAIDDRLQYIAESLHDTIENVFGKKGVRVLKLGVAGVILTGVAIVSVASYAENHPNQNNIQASTTPTEHQDTAVKPVENKTHPTVETHHVDDSGSNYMKAHWNHVNK